MADTKNLKPGSVDISKQPVMSKCPHCGKINPVVEALSMGESADSVMVGFVPQCCRKLLGCQMIAKQTDIPIIN